MSLLDQITHKSIHEQLAAQNARIEQLEQQLLEMQQFSGHYNLWRDKRITAIIEHYGSLWFEGKRILELGCGYGEIGQLLGALGADVTCSDARESHLEVAQRRYPHIQTVPANLEHEWPFEGHFDLILHLGLLYHLKDYRFALDKSLESATHIVLETEVCDSSDPHTVHHLEEDTLWYDQSFQGTGSRPSAAHLESIFQEKDAAFEQVTDSRCNALFHTYDWKVQDTGRFCHGLRRMWYINTQK